MSHLNSKLLLRLAKSGEMQAREWLQDVERPRGDFVDYYGAATLVQAGYVAANITSEDGLGRDTQVTAQTLCQLCLPLGQSFMVDDCPRESWWDFPVTVFITADGLLKLEEISNRKSATRLVVSVAILSAALSALLTALASGMVT